MPDEVFVQFCLSRDHPCRISLGANSTSYVLGKRTANSTKPLIPRTSIRSTLSPSAYDSTASLASRRRPTQPAFQIETVLSKMSPDSSDSQEACMRALVYRAGAVAVRPGFIGYLRLIELYFRSGSRLIELYFRSGSRSSENTTASKARLTGTRTYLLDGCLQY